MSDLEVINATIAAGTTVSSAAKIGVKTVVGFAMPATWASGALTFRVSVDGGTNYLPLVDQSNNPITVATPAAGTFISIDPKTFAGTNQFEIVCFTAPAANAVIGVAVRSVAF